MEGSETSLLPQVRRDTVAFSATITACERGGALESHSTHHSAHPRFPYGSVLLRPSEGSRWEDALQLLNVMDRNAVPRDVVTFNAVMSACENLGEHLD